MANWYGMARSNYFRVKDDKAFKEWAKSIDGLQVITDDKGRYGLVSEDDCGGWPLHDIDDETDEEIEFDIPGDVAKHLQEGEVAVFMEIGAEKLRYLTGLAVAINCKSERETVSIKDIYGIAEDLGDNITRCES